MGALVGAAVGYGIQVYNNHQNGLSGAAAWTQNISAEPIINGAFIGAGAVIGGFVLTQAAVALLPAATTASTLDCLDGDCTNEVTAVANAANNAVNAACADGDCTNEATLVFNRYISKAELDAIDQTGLLRGGRPGETFFTTDYYQTVSEATQRLSLSIPPEVGIEFQILNKPVINGPNIVAPIPGVTTGGGIEYWTSDPVKVIIRKTWELIMK